MMGTEARGASNAKAKRELGWTLRYPSWRQGFAAAYGRGNRSGPGREDAGRGPVRPPSPCTRAAGSGSRSPGRGAPAGARARRSR